MNELDENQMRAICVALGWQGGTYWMALEEIKKMRTERDELRARLAELERQKPVRLSDGKIEQARNDAVIGAPDGVLMGRIAGLWQAELYELARAIETAVLAANGLTK